MDFWVLGGKTNLISQVMNFENELSKHLKAEKAQGLIVLLPCWMDTCRWRGKADVWEEIMEYSTTHPKYLQLILRSCLIFGTVSSPLQPQPCLYFCHHTRGCWDEDSSLTLLPGFLVPWGWLCVSIRVEQWIVTGYSTGAIVEMKYRALLWALPYRNLLLS